MPRGRPKKTTDTTSPTISTPNGATDALTVYTTFPCCHAHVTLPVNIHESAERYQRMCKNDNRMWLVTRITLRAEPGIRSDTIRWETTEVSEHAVGTRRRLALKVS